MKICFRIGGQEHCYDIPVVEIPVPVYRPGPGPINYPPFLYDATLVASIEAVANKVTDAGVRNALQSGILAAVKALKARGGDHVSRVELNPQPLPP